MVASVLPVSVGRSQGYTLGAVLLAGSLVTVWVLLAAASPWIRATNPVWWWVCVLSLAASLVEMGVLAVGRWRCTPVTARRGWAVWAAANAVAVLAVSFWVYRSPPEPVNVPGATSEQVSRWNRQVRAVGGRALQGLSVEVLPHPVPLAFFEAAKAHSGNRDRLVASTGLLRADNGVLQGVAAHELGHRALASVRQSGMTPGSKTRESIPVAVLLLCAAVQIGAVVWDVWRRQRDVSASWAVANGFWLAHAVLLLGVSAWMARETRQEEAWADGFAVRTVGAVQFDRALVWLEEQGNEPSACGWVERVWGSHPCVTDRRAVLQGQYGVKPDA